MSGVLGIKPYTDDDSGDNDFTLWMYLVEEDENEPYYDFINKFLAILEPKLNALSATAPCHEPEKM